MNESQSPETWTLPNWHSDFAEARVELEDLRRFALLLLSVVPNARVALEILEPGLIVLQVALAHGTVAEVHSVPCLDDCEKRRFAIFFSAGTANEEEIYAESIDSAVNHFASKVSP